MSMISEQVKRLRKLANQWKHNDVAGFNLIFEACDTIEALSAKVRAADRSTGEWIIEDAHTEHCSVCGCAFYISALFAVGGNDEPNHCPNCGARMYKGGEDE